MEEAPTLRNHNIVVVSIADAHQVRRHAVPTLIWEKNKGERNGSETEREGSGRRRAAADGERQRRLST
jgi:hypothetical protein